MRWVSVVMTVAGAVSAFGCTADTEPEPKATSLTIEADAVFCGDAGQGCRSLALSNAAVELRVKDGDVVSTGALSRAGTLTVELPDAGGTYEATVEMPQLDYLATGTVRVDRGESKTLTLSLEPEAVPAELVACAKELRGKCLVAAETSPPE